MAAPLYANRNLSFPLVGGEWKLLKQGEELPSEWRGKITPTLLHELQEAGKLVSEKPTSKLPAGAYIGSKSKVKEPVPVFDDLEGTPEGDATAGEEGEAIPLSPEVDPDRTVEAEQQEGYMRPSPWVHDPASLVGMSLTELNILIRDSDDSIEPFETVEEASSFLSKDHHKVPKDLQY